MEDNEFFVEDTQPTQELVTEEYEHEEKAEPKKNKYLKVSLVFKILAVSIAVLSIACGIAFGFTKATTLVPYGAIDGPTFKTETIFELWRAVLFAIVGFSNGLCLWAISEVFKILGKKNK